MPPTKRYKWTDSSTKLLVTIWADKQIQSQMKATSRTQPIWDSIGRYMTKRGYPVSGCQCRTRIKNMTCLYQEALRTGAPADSTYFDVFNSVMSQKGKSKNEQKPSSSDQKAVGQLNLSSDEEYSREYLAVEILDPQDDQEASPGEQSPLADASIDSAVSKAIHVQTQVLKQLISDSFRSMECLLIREREKMEAALAIEAERRRQLEVRLDRLLTRVEAAAVPHLTYMGPIVAERDLIGS